MSKELELYKIFIDGLVERKDSMTARWVKGDGFPKTEDNKAKNELLATLTPEQKGIIAEMLQDEHIAGIHTMTSSAAVTAMSGRNNRRCDRCISKNTGATLLAAPTTV